MRRGGAEVDAALPLIGAVEGGGTKFVCAVARKAGDWLAQEVFRTREPEVTLAEVAGFFEQVQGELGPLRGLGIGCFGPLDLDEDSGGYGHITTTPKLGW
jgi:fructokinase